ncbi:MAG: autotransporter-associated beta strand repeat-containing protein [Verrucomicrobiota bacterium]|nr:autotransporter-associated beta strand repeat-containing protein [Verrucomicrobiota bacterium]
MNAIEGIKFLRSPSFLRFLFALAEASLPPACKSAFIGGLVAVMAVAAAPISHAQSNGDTLTWYGGTSQFDWSANSNIWLDNGIPVRLSSGKDRHNNYLFTFGVAGTNASALFAVPAAMQTGGNTFYSTAITFENLFNATNTTSLSGSAPTASSLVLGASNGQNSITSEQWSITNKATSGIVTFGPTAGNGNNNLTFALYDSGTISVAAGGNVVMSLAVNDFSASRTGGITKTGGGVLTLSGSNTFTGATTINAGTLQAVGAGALGSGSIGTSAITVNNGGTLLLGGSASVTDRINGSAVVTLNGGTFNTGGLSERNLSGTTVTPGLGALTLQSSSLIDLANGASILSFSNSSTQTWTGTLSIYNWSGTPVIGNGIDQLFFGTDTTGLTSTQLTQINFYLDSGTTFLGTAMWASGGNGEVTPGAKPNPIPEPSTWLAGSLSFAAIAYAQLRRVRRRSRPTHT